MSRSSDPGKLDAWRRRFQRFAQSGLAVARFCTAERVSVASFYYWRKRLGPQTTARHGTKWTVPLRRRTEPRLLKRGDGFQTVTVVPVASDATVAQVTSAAPAALGVSIQMPGGTRIEIGSDCLEAIRAVIAEVARVDHGTDMSCGVAGDADTSRSVDCDAGMGRGGGGSDISRRAGRSDTQRNGGTIDAQRTDDARTGRDGGHAHIGRDNGRVPTSRESPVAFTGRRGCAGAVGAERGTW